MTIKLIIGLRNPGSNYERTRHNAGGWFVEALSDYYRAHFKADKKLHGEMTVLSIEQHECRAMLPLTFMNHSGLPVREASQFYRINPNEILVVHDELDIPAGELKMKLGGGHGGHNGLRDIISHLGTPDFYRLRIGIGHPGHRDLVHNYVLGKPSTHDLDLINQAINRAVAIMPLIITGNIATIMNRLSQA